MTKKRKRQFIWIGLGLLSVISRVVLGLNPNVIEAYYSRTLFPFIRVLIDYTSALLPFPVILLFIVFVVFRLVNGLNTLWKNKSWSIWEKVGNGILGLLSFLGGITFFFLLLWGFNYGRVPIEDQLDLDLKALTYEELEGELNKMTRILESTRSKIPGSTLAALGEENSPADLETNLRALVENTMESLGYPITGRVQARILRPAGVLLRISTSGFYFPWTGESHVDSGLHPIQLPSVLAHELVHGYGITDEGTCNFIAYLACSSSKDPFIRYAGQFGYWRYLRGSLNRFDQEAFALYQENLAPELTADIDAVRKQMDLFPDILPKVRNLTYETYLKAQGISEGIKNYRRIVLLVYAFERKGKNS